MEKPPSGREGLPFDNESGARRKLLKKKTPLKDPKFSVLHEWLQVHFHELEMLQ